MFKCIQNYSFYLGMRASISNFLSYWQKTPLLHVVLVDIYFDYMRYKYMCH